ncbi:ABC transporter permease [Flexithrix dorotheae]|uniref:ABC transporter permease n=1 Tax=Flexithrix dorotheae TaxID=70993 RepID=UPI00036448A9|nr:ABC transporter permease [Flexithrix dorotheae]
MKNTSPPKLILRFFKWFCHPDLHPFIEGDLLEIHKENVAKSGKRKADIQFATDVFLLFRPSIIKPLTGYHKLNQYDMFKNYFKVSVRNLLKYKAFSFINIFGLAASMSICLLIILMLADQKSYDQFHTKKDRIYRILNKRVNHSNTYATVPFPIASTLKSDYPAVEEATSLRRGFGGDAHYNEKHAEIRGYFTDPGFLKIFNYDLEAGDPFTAMDNPNTIVISKKTALLLFAEENPIGKTIDFTSRGLDYFTEEGNEPTDWGNYTVTGVLAQNTYKTHLEFDVLVSSSSIPHLAQQEKINDLSNNWENNYMSYAYVLLNPKASEKDLNIALGDIVAKKFSDNENLKGSELMSQSLEKITPGPALGNEPITRLPLFVYYILSSLALVIMISACLNYTNLSVARAVTRSKEIGVRKVIGAKRMHLIFQLLSESIITSFLALVLANIILIFVKSAFLGLWMNNYLNFDLSANVYVYLIFLIFSILIGLISGIFPALVLSRYNPIKALKKEGILQLGNLGIRKVLNIIQFVFSLVFIITSLVVYNQFKYFMNFEYGFNPKNVLNINLQSTDFQLLKSSLSSIPEVLDITGCAYLPATGRNDNTSLAKYGTKEFISAIHVKVDENFIKTLELNLLAGRNLPLPGEGSSDQIIVNEAMVRAFGYDSPSAILGESFEERGGNTIQIVGVIEDFTFQLLFSKRPTGAVVLRNDPDGFKIASLKVSTKNPEIISKLEEKWETIDPIHPLKYEYYEDKLANNNKGIFDIVSIIGFMAFLAITIACLGLLGMAIYTTERRTKEIGIRKVLGANSLILTYLLSKEFLFILIMSILIAAPLSYFLNQFWLDFLVEKVDFGFGTVFIGSMLLLTLGLFTIGSQVLRLSNQNPVDSLRNE